MIIGIESSCDESAVALFDAELGVIFEEIASQIEVHGEYGGVVPELAAREHVKNFVPLFEHLKSFGVGAAKSIAVTGEPGLPGCVNIGVGAAKALSLILRIPFVEINHLHGHLFSPFIGIHGADPANFHAILRKKYLPHLGLLVSGGNTAIFRILENFSIETIAETQDDAAGEAFDKGAKLLGLPYPGGALVEKFAKLGDFKKYHFPRAFSDKLTMKFSFSGLKTSLRYFLENFGGDFKAHMNDICAAYQDAIVDSLAVKISHALEIFDCKSVGISGGVSNNDSLRNRVLAIAEDFGKIFVCPEKRHSGDNAAMIAFAAYVTESII
jgi:N6-L-threonylcarbamoyladenine synthase